VTRPGISRISQAQRNGRGKHYSIEIYIPRIKGTDTKFKQSMQERKDKEFSKLYQNFRAAIQNRFRGEARIYNDL